MSDFFAQLLITPTGRFTGAAKATFERARLALQNKDYDEAILDFNELVNHGNVI